MKHRDDVVIDPLKADQLLALLVERGAEQYGYEPVTQLEHALQSAYLAEQADAHPALVIAALFHDVGHVVDGANVTELERGRDDRHEMRGVAALRSIFRSAVCGPVAMHVAAKRYMCATEQGYLGALSPASRTSLELQGGPMTPAEQRAFAKSRYFRDAVALRRFDDLAKDPELVTPLPAHFARHWQTAL
jgi:[1-hydroxy-2-(trimethylamino)ethyl]phosphonate dioxygenase